VRCGYPLLRRWRNFGRKLDYWAIALSSAVLLRAVTPVPAPLTCAAVALTPFQPFAVTACNGAAVEVGRKMLKPNSDSNLNPIWSMHILSDPWLCGICLHFPSKHDTELRAQRLHPVPCARRTCPRKHAPTLTHACRVVMSCRVADPTRWPPL